MSVPSRSVFHLYLIALACISVSGGEDLPLSLNGLTNKSISMSLFMDPSRSVNQVIWNFNTSIMLTYTNSQLTFVNSHFRGRVEILGNGRTLRIGQLRLEDNAVYIGSIIYTDETSDKRKYNLSVYEPVPDPFIKIVEKTNNSEWCNVTLYCSVPKNTSSSISYTWKYRHGGSAYQLYDNTGNTIQRSLKKDSWDIEVMCIVQNPADSKNNSLQNFCLEYSEYPTNEAQNRNHYALLVLLVLILPLLLLACYLINMKRTRKKAETPVVSENVNREPQYIQVTTVQPNNDMQDWKNTLYDASPQPKTKAMTVYAVLEHPSETKR